MKQKFEVSSTEKKALAVATLITLLFSVFFFRQYIALIIFAAILAFIFNPTYQRHLQKGKQAGSAAARTLLTATAVILVPLILILVITGFQIAHVVQTVSTNVDSVDVTNFTQHLINGVNDLLAKTPITFQITPEWIHDTAATVIQTVGTTILNNIKVYVGGFFSFFTTAIIFIFVFLSFLKNQTKIGETIRLLNPLGTQMNDLYVSRIGEMTKAMVRGQFIIAIAQGFTDAALIYLAGFHEAFFFMLIILIALSFIPTGGGILAIPIGVIMMLTGNVIGGIVVIGGHLLIVTNIDNILRPRLVPPDAKLDPALMILSVFSGIALLGFLGIVVGPVIMIVIATTVAFYLQVYRGVPQKVEATPNQGTFGHRIMSLFKKHDAEPK